MNCAPQVIKYSLVALLFAVSGLVISSADVALPNRKTVTQWYSSEANSDLKQTLQYAIASAKHSVFISAFAFQDPSIISLIEKKGQEGLDVQVICDKRQSWPHHLKHVHIEPRAARGLFHRKILIVDDAVVYFGSANFTHSSLTEQANHIGGFYSPALAQFLKEEGSSFFQEGGLEVHKLPSQAALKRLVEEIDQAQYSIDLALFSLSHPKILDALKRAEGRRVLVRAIVDASSRGRASSLSHLYIWKGGALMHHKLALFDSKKIAFGSANWTQSAFEKNEDLLAFMPAPKGVNRLFDKLLQKSLAPPAPLP